MLCGGAFGMEIGLRLTRGRDVGAFIVVGWEVELSEDARERLTEDGDGMERATSLSGSELFLETS